MPWNLGIFSRAYPSWTNDANSNLPISATKFDAEDNDMAAGFNTLVGNLQQNAHFKAGSVAGTNTVTGSLTPALTGYLASMYVVLTPVNTNTGATTLNLNSLGALAVQNVDGTALVGGELVTGIPALLLLNSGATAWIVTNPANAFDIRQNIQNGNYTFALSDRGKHVFTNTGGPFTYTIPANASVAFPIGSTIVLVAFGAGTSTLAITSDTLYWANGSGADPTGSRSLASGSIVTLLKISATQWAVTGSGIS